MIVKFITNILSIFIFNKEKRRDFRHNLKTRIYGWKVFKNAKSIGKGLYIGGFSEVSRTTILGDYVHFNGMEISGEGIVTIGDYFHSGKDCLILAQNHNYKGDALPYDSSYIFKDVTIGNYVWMGSRVIVLPGTEIGDGCIIQAGSVVHGKIPPLSIIGGNPAKVFSSRDKEHYEKLIKENKFHKHS